MRRARGIAYNERNQGILHFCTNLKEVDAAEAPAAQMRELGCDRRVISADEAVHIEPALCHIRAQLAGAAYTVEDESGDANRLARELLKRCVEDGVTFLMSHAVAALRAAGGAIDHIEATEVLDRAAADHPEQRADHRPLEAGQAVARHRPRHPVLDARLRLGQELRLHRQRPEFA